MVICLLKTFYLARFPIQQEKQVPPEIAWKRFSENREPAHWLNSIKSKQKVSWWMTRETLTFVRQKVEKKDTAWKIRCSISRWFNNGAFVVTVATSLQVISHFADCFTVEASTFFDFTAIRHQRRNFSNQFAQFLYQQRGKYFAQIAGNFFGTARQCRHGGCWTWVFTSFVTNSSSLLQLSLWTEKNDFDLHLPNFSKCPHLHEQGQS